MSFFAYQVWCNLIRDQQHLSLSQQLQGNKWAGAGCCSKSHKSSLIQPQKPFTCRINESGLDSCGFFIVVIIIFFFSGFTSVHIINHRSVLWKNNLIKQVGANEATLWKWYIYSCLVANKEEILTQTHKNLRLAFKENLFGSSHLGWMGLNLDHLKSRL